MKDRNIYDRGRSRAIIFLMAGFVFFSCNNKKDDVVNPEALYFDYKVTAVEGNDNLTVLLQYRAGGEEGYGILISEPGKILLDGELLHADSNKMSGTFYEQHKPIAAFAGKHSIVFTGIDKKEYKEDFDFTPLVLLTTLSDTIQREELVLEFDGLDPEDYVRVLLTDTSYNNDGINRVDTVLNGRLVITKADLQSIANGPVQLDIMREYERPVKSSTKKGGRLLINYSLKREFFLKE